MRVIYVDLHANGHMVELLNLFVKRPSICKHRFILNCLIDNGVEVVDYVTEKGSLLPTKILRELTRPLFFRKLEAKYVLKKNGFKKGQIKIETDIKKIREGDVAVLYGTVPSNLANQIDFPCPQIVDMIHFFGDKEVAEMHKNWNYQYYMFDVDLGKYSLIYKKNYAWYNGQFIMRPYTYQSRFCVKTPFAERKNKAVAVGTVTRHDTPEFIEVYGDACYQPHRRMIMENAEQYPDLIDSFISPFQEKKPETVLKGDSWIVELKKKCRNYFSMGLQKSYFSFNMVDKLNEYKMFICPEDVQGSYGVGCIEGMACGCAMIGLRYGAFEDIGLEAGKTYIPYDGTMENLVQVISYYSQPENQKELEQIADAGCKYIRRNFSEDKVAKQICDMLREIAESNRK